MSYKFKLKNKKSCNETHSLNVALTYCGPVVQYVTIDSGSGLCDATQWCQAIMCTLFYLLNGRWNSANPTIYLFYIPQCTMRNRNVHISILNGVLWDMELVHCGICEIALLIWLVSSYLICNVNSVMHLEKILELSFSCKMTSEVLKIFTSDIEYQFSRGHDTQFWHLMCHCHLGPFRTCTKSSTNTPRLIHWKQ